MLEGDQIKDFRFVKEIRPQDVERRIASERLEIFKAKQRLVYKVDLDSLIEKVANEKAK